MLTQIQSLTDLKLFDKLFDQMIGYAPKLVGAILLYFIGSFLINRLVKIFGKVMIRKNYDKSLHTFFKFIN